MTRLRALLTRDLRRVDEHPPWTGPVVRRDPATYQTASTNPVRCRLCGHWSNPRNLACVGCGAAHPGGTPCTS